MAFIGHPLAAAGGIIVLQQDEHNDSHSSAGSAGDGITAPRLYNDVTACLRQALDGLNRPDDPDLPDLLKEAVRHLDGLPPALVADPLVARLRLLFAQHLTDWAGMETAARRVLRHQPDELFALSGLTTALLEQFRPQEALEVAQRYHALAPDDADGVLRLAAAHVTGGDEAAAIACADAALRARPGLPMQKDHDFLARQQVAQARGVPPLLINTMFKSASIFIAEKLAEGLALPRCYITLAGIANRIIPSALARFACGGAICQEHLTPDDDVLHSLDAAGIKRFVVHVRDPRQAAVSGVHHIARKLAETDPTTTVSRIRIPAAFVDWPLEKQIDYYLDRKFPKEVAWVSGWYRLSRAATPGRQILFTTFETFRVDPTAYFRRLLEFFAIPVEDFDWRILDGQAKPGELHFRKGATREWEQTFTTAQKQRAAAIMADAGLDFYLDAS